MPNPYAITEDETYYFDLRGYLIVRGALTSEEVANGNEAIVTQPTSRRTRANWPVDQKPWPVLPDGWSYGECSAGPNLAERFSEECSSIRSSSHDSTRCAVHDSASTTDPS